MRSIRDHITRVFGWIADPTKSICHNAYLRLASIPSWFYFDRPTNIAFHDLTTILKPPSNLRSLLGLGLKFCPIPSRPRFDPTSCTRFEGDIFLRTYFAGEDSLDSDYDPKLYIKSGWRPPPPYGKSQSLSATVPRTSPSTSPPRLASRSTAIPTSYATNVSL